MARRVLVTFANSPGNDPLPALVEEQRAIRSLFRPLDAKEHIRFHATIDATASDLIEDLRAFENQIVLLHFSGHANGQSLAFADGNGNVTGLSELLKANLKENGEQTIKLVFLNGCATAGQVEALQRAGVPAVIATAQPVFDEVAAQFSKEFYKQLTNLKTVLQAFQFAKGALRFEGEPDDLLVLGHYRGYVGEDKAESNSLLPWGLYSLPEDDSGVHWRLPYSREVSIRPQFVGAVANALNRNQYILRVLTRMCEIDQDIVGNYLEHQIDGQARPKDSSEYFEAIIEKFPWIIGSQIRLLRNVDSNRRLEELLSTYFISSQFVFYVILADCWRQKQLNKWEVSEELPFVAYPDSADALKKSDFCKKILATYRFMIDNNGVFTSPEIQIFCENISNQEHILYRMCNFLERTKDEFISGKLDVNSVDLLEKIERALTIFLSEIVFFIKYNVLTVRRINIDYPYTYSLRYELEHGKLNAGDTGALGVLEDERNRIKSNYCNSKTIVLSSGEDLHSALPLTPFIIDKNTFLGNALPQIFLFGYKEEDKYYYFSLDHDFFTAIEGGKGFDLIHTKLTDQDFSEGKTDLTNDEDFNNYFSDDNDTEPVPVFLILEEQHSLFQSHFTPYSRTQADE
jgi:hypothetical protein